VPLYFFNTTDNGTLVEDEVGSELPDLEAAKAQAVMALVELARMSCRAAPGELSP
jgi:hypothetical protein